MTNMAKTKIGPRGNAMAVTLNRDVLAASGMAAGDEVHIEADATGIRITKVDDAHARAMAAAEECMNRYPRALAELAK